MKDAVLYLPDGGVSTLWGAAVTACGVTRTAPGAPYPPNPAQHPGDHLFWLPRGGRILDGYQLLYIAAGKGTFGSAATGGVEIGAGSAFLLFPEVWHRYAPDERTGWTEYFLELRGPALDRLRAEGVLRPQNALFAPGVEPELVEAFEALYRLGSGEGVVGAREQMATLGMHLLAKIVLGRASSEPGVEERAVRAAQTRMCERLGEGFEMTELAGEFGIGYDRFRRSFKALTGLAPKQYYRQLQMRRAEMLLHSRRTLAEIAEELGFNSAFHFSAAFKAHAGMSPARWRERDDAHFPNIDRAHSRGMMGPHK